MNNGTVFSVSIEGKPASNYQVDATGQEAANAIRQNFRGKDKLSIVLKGFLINGEFSPLKLSSRN